jgi:outer membrane protein assembly factor BamB
VADGVVYVPPDDGYVYALDAHTGAIVWRREVPGGSSFAPAVANGVLYVGGLRLFALNAKTGAVLWKYGKAGRNTPAVANGVVYIPCRKKSVCALDAQTGAELWRYATHSSVNYASVVDGVLYVTSNDRNVYAFSLK